MLFLDEPTERPRHPDARGARGEPARSSRARWCSSRTTATCSTACPTQTPRARRPRRSRALRGLHAVGDRTAGVRRRPGVRARRRRPRPLIATVLPAEAARLRGAEGIRRHGEGRSEAEQALRPARCAAADPAIAADAKELQKRIAALRGGAPHVVETLYARWAELEAKAGRGLIGRLVSRERCIPRRASSPRDARGFAIGWAMTSPDEPMDAT